MASALGAAAAGIKGYLDSLTANLPQPIAAVAIGIGVAAALVGAAALSPFVAPMIGVAGVTG